MPPVLDSHERDRAEARNDGIVGDKDVSAVRRLECDAKAGFCHDRSKVASNWTPYLADARVRAPFAPKEDLPNSVLQSRPATTTCAKHTNNDMDLSKDKALIHRRIFASARDEVASRPLAWRPHDSTGHFIARRH